MSKRSIEDFKSVLQGGGVRPTMFEVELTFPDGVTTDGNLATRDGTFLIKSSQLPPSDIGEIQVPFRGRKLKVSGDRTFADWNVSVINDVSFGLRMAFEEWSERIQNHNYALGSTLLDDYYASAIVRQLDRDGTQLRAYRFEGIWPKNIAEIALDFNSTDEVEEYGVVFAVQYWSAIRDGDPVTSATPRDANSSITAVST